MAQVLRHLTPETHPNLLVGTETLDDAGVFRLDAETALVQTCDFFPPLVDDPFQFGRIAAANALSDVYAMGGEPLTALNLVGFPDKELPGEILAAILEGGAAAVHEAGAVVVGGHSVRDAEVKYGLAVTGRVHPERIWTNAGARSGDVLVLTKPIGSGVLTSAAKADKIAEAEIADAIAAMAALNRPGRDAAARVGVHGCTDITGFGLVGHAYEMAAASDVLIELDAAAVPLFARTLEFARQGVLTRAHKTTREYLGEALEIEASVEDALAGVLMDAQTSGGLLLATGGGHAVDLCSAAVDAGAVCAAVIGRVAPATGPLRVRLRG